MAEQRLAAQSSFTGLVDGEWVNLTIECDGAVIGDVACHLREGGGIAEIGFTLMKEHQGRGFASEAAGALVDHVLATTTVHRIEASLDPENFPSMRVLEALGMQFESRSRANYAIRGRWDDDVRYAMLRDDRGAWLSRPSAPPSVMEFVEITPDDAFLWGRLATHYSQQRFVAPMPLSFRDALFPEVVDGGPVVPWMRGVMADGERVAFVMLAEVTEYHSEPFLWRLLIDRMHQRRGIGTRVLGEIVRLVGEQGHRSLLTSWGDGPGGPRPFYERFGFVPTGNLVEGEVEARFSW
jgi:RimJ/RimL family protein N-acetyltransferase